MRVVYCMCRLLITYWQELTSFNWMYQVNTIIQRIIASFDSRVRVESYIVVQDRNKSIKGKIFIDLDKNIYITSTSAYNSNTSLVL